MESREVRESRLVVVDRQWERTKTRIYGLVRRWLD